MDFAEGFRRPVAHPPWHYPDLEGPYKGRLEWWADYKYKDAVYRSGRWRVLTPRHEAEDGVLLDPPVADGTSLIGPDGNDSYHVPRADMRDLKGEERNAWVDRVYKNTHHYKDVAAKFNLSKEHPGMYIETTMSGASTPLYPYQLSHVIPHSGKYIGKFMVGPSFFDSPINKDCHLKTVALLKYAVVGMMPVTILNEVYKYSQSHVYPTQLVKHYLQQVRMPIGMALVFAPTVCMTAAYRNRDDSFNWLAASTATGAAVGSYRNCFNSFMRISMTLSVVTLCFQALRTFEHGMFGRIRHTAGRQFPLAWKHMDLTDGKIPRSSHWEEPKW